MRHPLLIPTLLLSLTASTSAQQAEAGQAPAVEVVQQPDPSTAALQLQQAFVNVRNKMDKSVVTVTGYRRLPEGAKPEESPQAAWIHNAIASDYEGHARIGVGSGFMVSEEGHVITCLNFLRDKDGKLADLFDVETVGRKHTIAQVIAVEPTLNIAILKLEVFSKQAPPEFTTIEWGNSGLVESGHLVMACGDPWGPEIFYSTGIITSPPTRSCYQDMMTSTYIQTSITTHPEAYGGPLIDLEGKVVGMMMPRTPTNGFLPPEPAYGLSFALPSNLVFNLFKALKNAKSVRSPWLGFSVMSLAELRKELGPEAFNAMNRPRMGICIENLFDPSPALAAGIQKGDFMLKFNGALIHTPLNFQRALYLAGIGNEVTLTMWRDGEEYEQKITIEERPNNAPFK